MKQLSQTIALSLFGLNALQIVAAAGSAVILLQIFFNKLSGIIRMWRVRNGKKQIENDMWAIE